ncbi:NAD(P)H-quinone oxidoreductase [Chitinimonas sp.]|uniref:NAD(P)H-quinone oxidoreductase n=1 Tax=Chitinimonas sp. TaxID=1934313 RepID=UPI002F948A33
MKTAMRAVLQDAPGSADTLFLGQVARPHPGPGQLLVRVKAAGVNRADIVQREGRYPPPHGASPLLGLEVAGEVTAVGAGVTAFPPGSAVFGLVAGGGYAEYAVLDEGCAIAKPDWLSFAEAASLPEAWMTAWLNLVELAALGEGETVLIHAGASGVGAAAIQLARLRGATAVVTVGSEEKADFCRRLGAAHAINYRTGSFQDATRAIGGVDVILDCIGGTYLDANLNSLKPDGRLIVIGLMGGSGAELNLGKLLVKRLRVQGSTLRPQPLAVKARLTQSLRDTVLRALQTGHATLTMDRQFPLSEVAAAHRWLEENRNQGKVVLEIE